MHRSVVSGVLALSLIVFVGCADKAKISGTVTFTDGELVTIGQVSMRSADGATYHGYLDKNGRFSPGETRDGQPIPCGRYQVWLSGTETFTEHRSDPNNPDTATFTPVKTIDDKYTVPDTSPFTAEVKRGGSKTFNFTVERYVDPKKAK